MAFTNGIASFYHYSSVKHSNKLEDKDLLGPQLMYTSPEDQKNPKKKNMANFCTINRIMPRNLIAVEAQVDLGGNPLVPEEDLVESKMLSVNPDTGNLYLEDYLREVTYKNNWNNQYRYYIPAVPAEFVAVEETEDTLLSSFRS